MAFIGNTEAMAIIGVEEIKEHMKNYNFESEIDFGKTLQYMFNKCGYESWQEVHTPYNNIDMVLKRDNKYYAVELKLSLSDAVCDQAYNNKMHLAGVHSVICVPTKNINKYELSRVKNYFLSKFEIGLWLFNCHAPAPIEDLEFSISKHNNNIKTGQWQVLLSEVLYPKTDRGSSDIDKYLYDDQKQCTAGSRSGGVITPFKRSCDIIVSYLGQHPKATKKQIYTDLKGQLHWASYGSMCSSLRTFTNVEVIQKINQLLNNA